jgi:hypothetical protein
METFKKSFSKKLLPMKTKHRKQKHPVQTINWSSTPKVIIHGCARPGDWECRSCFALNFASRNDCKFCSTKRSGQPALVKPTPINTDEREVCAGDWQCVSCGEVVFARRDSCFRCHKKRDGTPPILRNQTHDLFPGDRVCKRCEVVVFASKSHCFLCQKRV